MKRTPRLTVRGAVDRRFVQQVNQLLRELGVPRTRHWSRLVGYRVTDLTAHLESKFTDGMNWDAFLRGEIEIDHIRPHSWFKYKHPDDPAFRECWGLANLQPLWKKDNRSKGARFEGGPKTIDPALPDVSG